MIADRLPPSLEDFETLAVSAYESLPAQMRRLCEGLEIFVSDFADAETDCPTPLS